MVTQIRRRVAGLLAIAVCGLFGLLPGASTDQARAAVPSGFLAGALNASVSTGGPPVAIWLRSVGASPNQMRHTLAVVFVAMNLLTIAVVAALDSPQISGEWGRALGGAVLGVPLGYAVGGRVLDRIDREAFERFVAIAITAIALLSAANGLSGL